MNISYYTFVKVDENKVAEIELDLEIDYKYHPGTRDTYTSPGDPAEVEIRNVIITGVSVHGIYNELGYDVSDPNNTIKNIIIQTLTNKKIEEAPLTNDDGSPLKLQNVMNDIQRRVEDKLANSDD